MKLIKAAKGPRSSLIPSIAWRMLISSPVWLAILCAISLHAEGGDADTIAATVRPVNGEGSETNDLSGRPQRISRLWIASAVALGSATYADIRSSHKWRDYGDGIRWRRMEANPLYRSADGSFGKRGMAIRGGSVAGALFAQYLTVRHPDTPTWVKRALVAINFVAAELSFGAAHRNYSIDRRPTR